MLDQNTDRMWYVIGAILLGAAIIFGASTMFPRAFASVGGMMSGVIGNIHLLEDVDDDISDMDFFELDGYNMISDATFINGYFNYTSGGGTNTDSYFRQLDGFIDVDPNTDYLIATNLPYDTSIERGLEIAWVYRDENNQIVRGNNKHNKSIVKITTPANAHYIRVRFGYPQRSDYSHSFDGALYFFGRYDDYDWSD